MDTKSIVAALKNGEVVVFPTDTLHAISANACDDLAVKKVVDIKCRGDNHPMPVLVRDVEQAKKYVDFTPRALELANKYWPGALTIVLPPKDDSGLSKFVNRGVGSLAVRMPDSKIAQEILNAVDFPLIGTSANVSGQPNLITEQEMYDAFGGKVKNIIFSDDIIFRASTIVDCTSEVPRVIREGVVKI
jgi:L-threonylcarbamoyladenylate synthase